MSTESRTYSIQVTTKELSIISRALRGLSPLPSPDDADETAAKIGRLLAAVQQAELSEAEMRALGLGTFV